MIVSVQNIKVLLRKMIMLLVLLSCKLKVTMWRLQPGPSKVFQPIRNRSSNKELGVRTPSATMLFFDWLFSIPNSSPFRMVCRNTYPPYLSCVTAFSKISKLVMISMGRAGYTNSSVGGGGGYKIVLRGKGPVWLLDRFYINYPACFLHPLSYCFNSKDNKKTSTSVVLCLERWVESSKNVSMFSSQKCYFTVLVAGKLAVGIVKNCNVYKYTNPLRQIQVFQILPLFSLQTSTLPINSQPDQITCS